MTISSSWNTQYNSVGTHAIYTLPAGMRPAQYVVAPIFGGGATLCGRLIVGTNGNVDALIKEGVGGIDFTVAYIV